MAFTLGLGYHPHQPKACGYVDGLGYLYCIDCAAKYDKPRNRPVYNDQSAHVDEQCDGPGCKHIIGEIKAN